MKITLHSSLFITFLCVSFFNQAQTFDNYRSVSAYATIDEQNTEISIKWEATSDASAYTVFRRDLGATNWGSAVATLGATDSIYTDNSVVEGKVYEYSIKKRTTITEPLSQSGIKTDGYGYVSAAINKPAKHYNGIMWVLIADNINSALPQEIETLVSDLIGDGWDVRTQTIPLSYTVAEVKAVIDGKYDSVGIDAIYLLGNVAVPYSGTYCQDENWLYPPDGHYQVDPNSHCGAWPADVYYGVRDGLWTDLDSTTLAKRDENNNAIGDGKFDNNVIPGDVTIAVGRVDLSRLTSFSETEVQLTKRYLDKVHRFKMAQTTYQNKGIIENNFSAFDEGFAGGAYRDFSAYFGPGGIVNADIFTTTASDNYLFSYGAGAGWYTSCSGYGNTADFTTKKAGMFSYIFGSFFGDYDIQNNFMRASLATPEGGLICTWNGRPKWVTHTLAIGESFADVTIRTQNNNWDYDALFYQNTAHIALLGDPSLRTEMLAPATIIQSALINDDKNVELTWTASTASDINGYYIYHSPDSLGGFILLNQTPITSTTYTDLDPWNGPNFYMIRAAKTITTGSGSYENLSIGNVISVYGASGKPKGSINSLITSSFKMYPTLTNSYIVIESNHLTQKEYYITNSIGQTLLAGKILGKNHKIDVNNFEPGTYFFYINNSVRKFVKY
jgi:hypothetical protein